MESAAVALSLDEGKGFCNCLPPEADPPKADFAWSARKLRLFTSSTPPMFFLPIWVWSSLSAPRFAVRVCRLAVRKCKNTADQYSALYLSSAYASLVITSVRFEIFSTFLMNFSSSLLALRLFPFVSSARTFSKRFSRFLLTPSCVSRRRHSRCHVCS